jgi:hypothetical protein
LAFSYWFDKPRFLTEGKHATVLIIPSSWGSQLGGYLPTSSIIFWRRCRGKRRLLQGEFRMHILYFVLVVLYFIFTCIVFIKNKKKLVSFIVVIFTCLLLALLECVLMRTPSCVILLALIIVILSALPLRHLLLLEIFMRLKLLY